MSEKLAEEITTEKWLQPGLVETHLAYTDKSDVVKILFKEKQLKNPQICISVKQTSSQRQQQKIPVEWDCEEPASS